MAPPLDRGCPMQQALGHRVLLNFEAEAEGVRVGDLIADWRVAAESRG